MRLESKAQRASNASARRVAAMRSPSMCAVVFFVVAGCARGGGAPSPTALAPEMVDAGADLASTPRIDADASSSAASSTALPAGPTPWQFETCEFAVNPSAAKTHVCGGFAQFAPTCSIDADGCERIVRKVVVSVRTSTEARERSERFVERIAAAVMSCAPDHALHLRLTVDSVTAPLTRGVGAVKLHAVVDGPSGSKDGACIEERFRFIDPKSVPGSGFDVTLDVKPGMLPRP